MRAVVSVVAIALTTLCIRAADAGTNPGVAGPTPASTPPSSPPGPLVRMIFPANPPPLGVVIPRIEHDQPPLSEKERRLSGEVLEPYFAPLSTYIIEPWQGLGRKRSAVLEVYRARRAELVAELRRTIEAVGAASPNDRLAIFATLAAAQEPPLVALEKTAEELRAALALELNWNDRREWLLNHGDLNLPREKTAVLELQVIRATAFYRGDLTPAQRRLLREAARHMEDRIFVRDGPPPPSFQFFSPDMMLVRFPSDLPKEIADEIALYAERKEALRQELRDAVYQTDGDSGFGRGRVFSRLAIEQAPRIDALEDLAEAIRRNLVNFDHSWRRSAPVALPSHVNIRLDAYLATRQQLQEEYWTTIEPIVSTPPPESVRANPSAHRKWQDEFNARLKKATADFQREHLSRENELDQAVIPLDEILAPHYEPADSGKTARATVMNFVHRRRVEAAYYEFDVAAFEPGLSPRQRALLFAAAMASLDLPLPDAERQPVKTPRTLIK